MLFLVHFLSEKLERAWIHAESEQPLPGYSVSPAVLSTFACLLGPESLCRTG